MIPVGELEAGDRVRVTPDGPVVEIAWRNTRRVSGISVVRFVGSDELVHYGKDGMLYDEEGA